MGGSHAGQMIAPLKTKLIGIEIGKAHDSRIEGLGLALRRRWKKVILSDVIRTSSRRHHAAACASGFSER
jgi:hypothetical protein